jgi:hypothetical protein
MPGHDGHSITLQSSRDQELHDLVRPRLDAHHARVAEEARDGVFVSSATRITSDRLDGKIKFTNAAIGLICISTID